MDNPTWDIIKDFCQWLILPILGSAAFVVRKYITRLEDVERQVNILTTKTAVIETKLDTIKDGVDQLLERSSRKRK